MKMENRFNPASAQRAAAWLDSPTKPTWMKGKPVTISLVALLLAHEAQETPWTVNQTVLVQACGSSPASIKRELDILTDHGWLSKTGTKGEVKGLSLLNADRDGYSKYLNTPVIQITPEAKEFASWYHSVQKQSWSEVSKRNKRES